MVRTSALHADNPGSNPGGITKLIIYQYTTKGSVIYVGFLEAFSLNIGKRQSWRAAADCKSVSYGLVGSNPTLPTKGIFQIPRSGKIWRGRGDERIALFGYIFLDIKCSR